MKRRDAILGTFVVALSACSRNPAATPAASPASPANAMTVYKDAGCGCCDLWVEHLQAAGFVTQVHERSDMAPVKERAGVPAALRSCHTGEIGGYFVEGHVPAADLQRLLRERPDARGLAVPGMPLGSPGMEVQGRSDPYDVLLVAKDGSTSVYAHHGA